MNAPEKGTPHEAKNGTGVSLHPGVLAPYSVIVPWVAEHGINGPLFLQHLFANPISPFLHWMCLRFPHWSRRGSIFAGGESFFLRLCWGVSRWALLFFLISGNDNCRATRPRPHGKTLETPLEILNDLACTCAKLEKVQEKRIP